MNYEGTVVIGRGLEGLLCAALLPGCTVVGRRPNLVGDTEMSISLANQFGVIRGPKDPVVENLLAKSRHYFRDFDARDASIWMTAEDSIFSDPYFKGDIYRNLTKSVKNVQAEGTTYRMANHVWGKVGTYLSDYYDKTLGLWQRQPPPWNLWLPPSRWQRFRAARGKTSKKLFVNQSFFQGLLEERCEAQGVKFDERDPTEVLTPAFNKNLSKAYELQFASGKVLQAHRIVNTVSIEAFASLIGYPSPDRFTRWTYNSGRGYVVLSGEDYLSNVEDFFYSRSIRATRVIHLGHTHTVEIPMPVDITPQDGKDTFDGLWHGDVDRLMQQGVFGKPPVEVVDSEYTHEGLKFVHPDCQYEWWSFLNSQRDLMIYHPVVTEKMLSASLDDVRSSVERIKSQRGK